MYIIHIAPELAPVAKVGGLADVVFGLARETQKGGHLVEVIIPKYDSIDYSQLHHLRPEYRDLWSFDGSSQYHNTIWSAEVEELKLFLVEPHHPSYFFSRGAIYGFADDIGRFTYFSRTVLEYLFKSGKRPDILHIHDWPTSVVAVLYKEMYIPLGFRVKGVVLTIHNLQYQGVCKPDDLTRIGLRGIDYLTPNKLQHPLMPHEINLVKGGIEYADFITTVSPTYQEEIKTPRGGHGLHQTLMQHEDKLCGILNGIDFKYWNPKTDPFLFERYSVETVFRGKYLNKINFRKKLGFKPSKAPLICSISRLDSQKGIGLIVYTLKHTVEKEGQFVLIGSSSNQEIELAFKSLQKELIKNKNVLIYLEYNEELAHQAYAASDMIVIPSLFEPCGLTQMIALRYGAVPLVRSTGGLADTIFDVDTSQKSVDERNGFCFEFPDRSGVEWALNRALSCYKETPERWKQIVFSGMNTDFSWERSSNAYIEIYQCLKEGREPRPSKTLKN